MREWAHGDDGLFKVFDAVCNNYLKEIALSAPGETDIREQTYHRIRALADIRRVMEVVITEGSNAEKMLTDLSRKAEKMQKRKTANVA
jgi:hypothetical protein